MSRTLLIDFETYSELNIKRVGAYRYSTHPSTDIICMSWSFDPDDEAAPVHLWTPEDGPPPAELVEAVCGTTLIEAHNAQFERCIWSNVAVPRYDFPPVFDRQWRCSLAVCAYRALPLKLETVAEMTRLATQKDMAGNRAMQRISKPDKSGERPRDFDLEQRTYSYCVDDNLTERALHRRIGTLPPSELQVWQLDQEMQERGVRIDVDLCRAAVEVAEKMRRRMEPELAEITDGAVKTVGQVAEIRKWLEARGVFLPDLTADEVAMAVRGSVLRDRDPEAHRVLEIRQMLAGSAHKKYGKALEVVCDDGRARGLTQYHGAGTGRWSGRLLQPQNFRRPRFFGEGEDIEALAAAIKTRDPDVVEMVAGCPVMEALADGVRGMIVPDDGNVLVAGDYSAIEAVVTAALAGEERKLDVFRRGEDPYCWFASKVVGRTVRSKRDPDVTPEDLKARQLYGKPGELAFGFSGGVGAWRNFSDELSDEEVDGIKRVWREAHPRIENYWNRLDDAVLRAVANPGEVYRVVGEDCEIDQGVAYQRKGPYLLCQLPSLRRLHYFRPEIKNTLMPWVDRNGDPVYKPQVWYWTMTFKGWRQVKGWRGLWTENIVQAVARDLMVAGMFAVNRSGYPPILTVHDEVVCEAREMARPNPETFSDLLVNPPPYAEPWPIAADAWIGYRYRKAA